VAPPGRVRPPLSVPGERAFVGVSVLLFAAALAGAIVGAAAMSVMGGMRMPGGWTLSMTWMPLPGQTWPAAWASFLGMWTVMMVAMMLPSLVPMLRRYRRAVAGLSAQRLGRLSALAGAGYFAVWIALGVAVFPLGGGLAAIAMQRPAVAEAVPLLAGVLVALAGGLQFTGFKAHHLACCRETPGRDHPLPPDAGAAWRHGIALGLHCAQCCAGLTAILLVMGVMDLRAMAAVAAAIMVERVAPDGTRAGRAIGSIAVVAGVLLVTRAAGLG
jgi:predicted metal-binding membrane protein